VVEPIAAALNGDLTREIYLTGVLGAVGTERGVEIVIGLLARRRPKHPRDIEMYSAALTDIGSPAAIPVIEALRPPGDRILAQHLLVLHAVNGLDHAQMPARRRLVAAEDERAARLTESLRLSLNDPDEPMPGDAQESEQALPSPETTVSAPAPSPAKRKRHRKR